MRRNGRVQLLASLCHCYLARLPTRRNMTHKCRTEARVTNQWYDITTLHNVTWPKHLTCTWSIQFDSNHACSELQQANLKKTERNWKVGRLNRIILPHFYNAKLLFSTSRNKSKRVHTLHLFTFGPICCELNSHHQGSPSTVRSFQDHYKLTFKQNTNSQV